MKLNREYRIDGMTCINCVDLIKKEATEITGISKLEVDYLKEKAYLVTDSDFNEEEFRSLISNLGYRLKNEKTDGNSGQYQKLFEAIILLLIGILFMLLMYKSFNLEHKVINWGEFLISTIVLAIYQKKYSLNIWRFIIKRQSDMHTLIGIGLFTTYFYSLFQLLNNPHEHSYIEALPFILGFTLLGQYFEAIAKTKMSLSADEMYKMQIKFANKLINQEIISTPVIKLVIGDMIRIRPGEKIPVNGKVIKGESHTDEAYLTGESIPIYKGPGANVFAGVINLEGSLDIEVTSQFTETKIALLINEIEKAMKNRTSFERITNRLVQIFVPFIIFFSLFTFAYWGFYRGDFESAFLYFITTLLISCPCALGLAAPLAVLLTTRNFYKEGISISGGEVIEIASKIDTIIFDKTGTLTEGKLKYLDFIPSDSSADILKLKIIATSFTALSTHPVSNAITKYGQINNIETFEPDSFKTIAGKGIVGNYDGKKIILGNANLLREQNIIFNEDKSVYSKLYLAIDSTYQGVFLVSDQVKDGVREFLFNIKNQFNLIVLSGDNEEVCRDLGQKLGLNNVVANMSPEGKRDYILELKKKNHFVAMVGDGINDSLALTSADLSIAMDNGSDLAISTSKVSLSGGNILVLDSLFNSSKKSVKIIRENLFFSFVYNFSMIPIAAGFFKSYGLSLNPKYASLLMGISSLSIFINSLRLKK